MAIPPRGIYVPAVAFFDEEENLDLGAIATHLTRLAKANVDGLVIQGSNGEAMHMTHDERQQVIRLARKVLDTYGKPGAVIVAGVGAQSTREAVQLCKEAREAGADFGLALSPSYWRQYTACPMFKEDAVSADYEGVFWDHSRRNVQVCNLQVLQ